MPVITVNSENELGSAAKQLLELGASSRVFAFKGEMGAGKTTFIKAICRELGVAENMSSPTFSLVNEYRSKEEEPVYHFDFYRIKNESEAYDLGYEDYLYSGFYCFIEWPEKIPGLIPGECVQVEIRVENGKRLIHINR